MITKEQYEGFKEEVKLIKAKNEELRKKYSEYLLELMKIEKEFDFNRRRLNTCEAFIYNYEKHQVV